MLYVNYISIELVKKNNNLPSGLPLRHAATLILPENIPDSWPSLSWLSFPPWPHPGWLVLPGLPSGRPPRSPRPLLTKILVPFHALQFSAGVKTTNHMGFLLEPSPPLAPKYFWPSQRILTIMDQAHSLPAMVVAPLGFCLSSCTLTSTHMHKAPSSPAESEQRSWALAAQRDRWGLSKKLLILIQCPPYSHLLTEQDWARGAGMGMLQILQMIFNMQLRDEPHWVTGEGNCNSLRH